MNTHITTAELDAIARLGLDDLRECFSATPRAGSLDRAELTLKILRQGTSRMSGENNRMAIALKVGKAANVPQDQQHVLWRQIVSSITGDDAEQKRVAAKSEGKGHN